VSVDPTTETDPADWYPVRRVNLSEEVADQLVSRILQGKLTFGEKLPPERDLARMLDVGRPTIREAIKALSVIGLVDVRPGEGTFIVDRHLDFVAKAFSWTLLLDARTAVELTDVRTAIECQQARLAARRATEAETAALREIIGRMETAPDPEALFRVDLEFHLAISRAAANVALERLLVASRSLLRQWILLASSGSKQSIPALVAEHRAIVDAIEARDEEAADRAMRLHVAHVSAMIEEAGKRAPSPDVTEAAQRARLDTWPWQQLAEE
jgi:GntR family transcriptional repressor for pyruvate dehydrogenase complex